ncbi:hypothetical protein [Roseicella sp. DB1501]|uniref:hypothetical protein n=1 Tax=Roseicella sp. DB1501 TaxID=2730925 RepID=UPI00149143F3|nr:hypothetical protein [Roseicella sp. DB1501]NOG71708.1 hypothetical protein [Roseicella sp. DB1501]
MDRSRDGAALALLFGGVGLAVIAAFFLPVLHFRGTDRTLLGLSAWQAVPLMTLLKLAVLALAVAAALLPSLRALRLPIAAAAAIMIFAPAIGALLAAVTQASGVRTAIEAMSGSPQTWIDPGWGLVALLAAALMLIAALRRIDRAEAGSA